MGRSVRLLIEVFLTVAVIKGGYRYGDILLFFVEWSL